MSVVTVQVGQCGNQLGMELFDMLYPDLVSSDETDFEESLNIHFNEAQGVGNSTNLYARAVLLDMEPKVIQNCLSTTKSWGKGWCYSSRRSLVRQHGSGNNWAYGYNVHGPQVWEGVSDLCRKEVEACDHFGGILLLHSAAGGTGSGLGSFLTERLRDAFDDGSLVNAVVWPHRAGEVVVQGYNTALTLAHLCGGSGSGSHAVVSLFNDTARRVCREMLQIARPSLADLNKVMARDLALALLPSASGGSAGRGLLSTVRQDLCPHPSFKLLEQKSVPQMSQSSIEFSSDTWQSLVKHLYRMHASSSSLDLVGSPGVEALNKSVASQLVLRGEGAAAVAAMARAAVATTGSELEPKQNTRAHQACAEELSLFYNQALYAKWSNHANRFSVRYQEKPRTVGVVGGYEKVASLLSNSQTIVKPLNLALEKATSMWTSQAYVHQYAKFGIDNSAFTQAFFNLEQVVDDYTSL